MCYQGLCAEIDFEPSPLPRRWLDSSWRFPLICDKHFRRYHEKNENEIVKKDYETVTTGPITTHIEQFESNEPTLEVRYPTEDPDVLFYETEQEKMLVSLVKDLMSLYSKHGISQKAMDSFLTLIGKYTKMSKRTGH